MANGNDTTRTGSPGAGWYRDPHDRDRYRYWSGTMWSPYVTKNGVQHEQAVVRGTPDEPPDPRDRAPVDPPTPHEVRNPGWYVLGGLALSLVGMALPPLMVFGGLVALYGVIASAIAYGLEYADGRRRINELNRAG